MQLLPYVILSRELNSRGRYALRASRSAVKTLVFGGVFIAFGVIGLGCTTNLAMRTPSFLTGGVPVPVATGGTSNGTFNLSRVVKNTLLPNTVIDLVGDGSGMFSQLCLATNSGSGDPSTAPTVCECSLTYSSPNHPNQQLFTPITYHEADLLRCSYASVPADVSQIKVAIHLSSAEIYSNTLTLNLLGSGTTLDPSLSTSFLKPLRYQCRDVVYIPYALDGSIYDPFQSENPRLSYPINFYATNLGGILSLYSSAQNQSYWICPPILNPDLYMSNQTDLDDFNAFHHMNMKIFSKGALRGSKQIYPPTTGVFDRSTFYLAKKPAGVFTVSVNAKVAPGYTSSASFTSLDQGGAPPLGYAANPVPIGIGTGQETCPTTATIPGGFHWAKLWLFRASLAQRHYAVSTGNSGITAVQSINCLPGYWGDKSPVFPGCTKKGGGSIALSDLNYSSTPAGNVDAQLANSHFLADRSLYTGQCVKFDDTSGLVGTPNNYFPSCLSGHPGPGCSSADEDLWTVLSPYLASSGCATGTDPLNLCPININGVPKRLIGQPQLPLTYSITTGDLDTGDGNARYDFLFVVTPKEITLANMQDTSSSSPSLPYQPYRFLTDQDCRSSNPDAPLNPGDCLPANAITSYGLKLHDVNSNGDPPGDDPNRAGVFPVCVLQPDPEGPT